MRRNALVTGAAGFMGSHIVDNLIRNGYHVIAVDDLSGGFVENVNKKAIFLQGSVSDNLFVKDVFKNNKIDYVFHLAAYAAENLSHHIKRFNYINNLLGSINLINESVNNDIRCFVFTSSIAVYGENQLPMTETLVPIPEDSYGIAKLAVELELKATKDYFGLDYIVFRPHNVFGERQNICDKYRNVVGIFMNQILKGEPMTIFGDGLQTRAFTYIGNVAPIIAQSIENEDCYNQIYNLGDDDYFTVNDLAGMVAMAMGVDANIRYLGERNEVKHAYSDHTKIKTMLGYKTLFTVEEGLIRMARWVKKNGAKETKKFGEIELEQRLPEYWKK